MNDTYRNETEHFILVTLSIQTCYQDIPWFHYLIIHFMRTCSIPSKGDTILFSCVKEGFIYYEKIELSSDNTAVVE